jgi:hypothetical protein
MKQLVQIDHDVPLPIHGNSKYPWHQMEVGDSFLIARCAVQPPINILRKGWKFTRRETEEGWRIWRVK